MLRDINSVRLGGSVFWSKLDDRQSFSYLRVGLKIEEGGGVFCTINNPAVKAYELIKPGNKLILFQGWLDLWEKKDGPPETQLKAYDYGVLFMPKEHSISGINSVTMLGTVISYKEEFALIEMIGDRNPKTGKLSKRQAEVKIGDKYESITEKKIFLQGKINTSEIDGKSKLTVEADYKTVTIL